MNGVTRGFLATGLIALVIAAVLHVLILIGYAMLWTALVHLLLLGWITALIYAVNYHTMPVFSGRDFPSPRLSWTHWVLWAAGVVITTLGSMLTAQPAIIVGLVLEFSSSALFVANTVLLFRRGPRRTVSPPPPPIANQARIDRLGTQATKLSGICLPLALMLMLAVRLGWLRNSWWLAAEHLITLGWIMFMIVGVAYHVLPRFSGRAVRGVAWVQTQIRSHIVALAVIVVALGVGWPILFAFGGALMALAFALFALAIWPTLADVRHNFRLKERAG